LIFISLALAIFFAVLIVSIVRLNSKVSHGLGIYILVNGNLILAGFLAHFFHQINSRSIFLVAQSVLLILGILAWLLWKKPSLVGPWRFGKGLFSPGWMLSTWRQWSAIWTLGIVVLVFFIVGFIMILLVPPNTNDILTTHLTRVLFWLQHGDMLPWNTPNNFNLIYPVNANLLMLWTMLFTKNWFSAGFIQWFGALAGAVGIYGLSRRLGWHRAGAIFAGLVWLSLPEILLQSTTTQLDLIVAVFAAIAIYFLIASSQSQNSGEAVLSGLAVGMAVGTKQAAIFLLPGFAFFLVLLWVKDRKSNSRSILTWMIAAGICTILFGSYIYFQNLIIFKNPLGDPKTLSQQVGGQKGWGLKDNLSYNSARFFYQSLDVSGIPLQFSDNFVALKIHIFKPIFTTLQLDLESPQAVHDANVLFQYGEIPPIQEDKSWYGLLGFALIFILTPIQLVQGIRRRDPYRIGLVAISFIYSLLVIAFRPGWDPYQGRYFIPVVTFTAPFLASLVRTGLGWRVTVWSVTIISMGTMLYSTLTNNGKPLLSYPRLQGLLIPNGSAESDPIQNRLMTFAQINFPAQKDIWDMDMIGRQLIQSGMMVKPVRMIDKFVPEGASLAIGFSQNLPVLPFFGEHFTRKLFPVFPTDKLLDRSWFQDNKIDFLLLHLTDPQMPDPPAWLIPYQTSGDWALFYPEWNVPPKP
jgi:4-amino-4-deoxy-L-arabinose transferase-like glycosyltransferase